ncbi:hypothetical protein PPGU19_025680 [Paraburkholderia sp. PGU19]|nr:hypothetical protein PPGU19_025680 [Paraburkholderia sp. PGU19]
MTGLKKLFNVAVLLFMVCWSLALLVPDQTALEHDTHASRGGEAIERHPAYEQIRATRVSIGTP